MQATFEPDSDGDPTRRSGHALRLGGVLAVALLAIAGWRLLGSGTGGSAEPTPASPGASPAAPVGAPIPAVHLTLARNALAEMQRSLRAGDPSKDHDDGGDKPYFKATFVDGDAAPQRCTVCLRGLMAWHHDPSKPSLRVRLDKDDVRGGDRFIELSRPEDMLGLKNWLPLQIAQDLDLITDRTEHVRLFLDDEYHGLYLRSMRQGEELARRHGRTPGTFWKGEGGALWQSAEAWSMAGTRAARDRAVFERFLHVLRASLLAPPTAALLDELHALLDPESYARWAALMIVTGSLHTDLTHNHSYFFCPTKGRLEAVPWDCNSFGIHATPDTPVDAVQHPVMLAMVCDPRWVHRRNQWIAKLVGSTAGGAQIVATVQAQVERMRGDLEADRNLGDIRFVAGTWQFVRRSSAEVDAARDELLRWVEERSRFVAAYLADARVIVEASTAPPGRTLVHVVGAVAVRVARQDGGVVAGSQKEATLFPGLSQVPVAFTNSLGIGTFHVQSAPLTTTLEARAEDLTFRNAITGEAAIVESAARPSTVPSRTIQPDQLAAPRFPLTPPR